MEPSYQGYSWTLLYMLLFNTAQRIIHSTNWIDYPLYSYLPPSPVFLPVLPPAESVLWSPPRHMVSLHSFPTHQESTYECSAPTTHWETCSWLSSSYGCFPFPFGGLQYSLLFLCLCIVQSVTMETEEPTRQSSVHISGIINNEELVSQNTL